MELLAQQFDPGQKSRSIVKIIAMAPLSTPSHQRADEALSFRREDPDFEKNFDSPITVVIDAGHPPPNSMPAGPLGFLFQGRQHPHAPRAPISEMASGPARESPNLHALTDPSSSAPPPLATPRSPSPVGGLRSASRLPERFSFAATVSVVEGAPELLPLKFILSAQGRPGLCQLESFGSHPTTISMPWFCCCCCFVGQTHEAC